jgi:hypothetical protein
LTLEREWRATCVVDRFSMTTMGKNARIAGALYLAASLVGIPRLGYIPKVHARRGVAPPAALW